MVKKVKVKGIEEVFREFEVIITDEESEDLGDFADLGDLVLYKIDNDDCEVKYEEGLNFDIESIDYIV